MDDTHVYEEYNYAKKSFVKNQLLYENAKEVKENFPEALDNTNIYSNVNQISAAEENIYMNT